MATVATAGEIGDEDNKGKKIEDDQSVAEIVVTAQKFSEVLQKVSIAVLVVNGDNALRAGLPNVDQVLTGQTGIQTQPGPRGTNFTVRGFDGGAAVTSSSDVSATGGLAIVVDGVYQPRSEGLRAGLLDVSQIEVLKGAQSTTIGGSSLIGAINVSERQPEFSGFNGQASFGVGTYGLRVATAAANVPLGDTLALRLAAQTNVRDGYVASNAADLDSSTIRAKLRWQPNEMFNSVLTFERAEQKSNGEYTGNLLYKGSWQPATSANTQVSAPSNCVLPNLGINQSTGLSTVTYATLGCPPKYVWTYNAADPTYRDRSDPWNDGLPKDGWPNNPHSNTTTETTSLRLDFHFDFADLVIVPSHQWTKLDQEMAVQATRIPLSKSTQKTDQVDVRLVSNHGDRLQWLLGGYYFYTDAPFLSGNETFPGYRAFNGFPLCAATSTTNCTSWSSSRKVDQETYSFYGNTQLQVLKNLRLLAGLRYQHDSKQQISSGNNPIVGGDRNGPGSIVFPDLVNVKANWQDISFRGGFEYDLAPSTMVYATYGTGYQPGFITATAQNTPITKKQTVNQVTVGLKSDLFERRVRVNVEGFNGRYHDYLLANTNVAYGYVIAAPSTSFIGCSVLGGRGALASLVGGTLCATDTPNADLLTSRGVDVDLTWNVTPKDRLDISAEYLDTKVTGVSANVTVAAIQTSVPTATAAQVQAAYDGIVAYEQQGIGGQPLQNAPNWTINVSYQHRFDLPGGSSLTPRINVLHKTEYYTSGYGSGLGFQSNKDPSVQPTYNLVNLSATWASANNRYTVNGFIRNLGNYPVLLNYVTGPRPYSAVTLGEPRTYGVTATARF